METQTKKSSWIDMFERVEQHTKTHLLDTQDREWTLEQQSKVVNPNKNNQLSRKDKILLSYLPNFETTIPNIDVSWLDDFGKVKNFIHQYGRLPENKININEVEKALASWCDRQRQAFLKHSTGQKNSLRQDFHWSIQKQVQLESLGDYWFWKKGDQKHWIYMCMLLNAFFKKEGRLPSKADVLKESKHLWSFIQKQRRIYSKSQKDQEEDKKQDSNDEKFLTESQIKMLESLPEWKWKQQKQDSFLKNFSQVAKFSKDNGRFPEIYAFDDNEKKLYKWCSARKNDFNGKKGKLLKEEQIIQLTQLPGWQWELETQQQWNRMVQETQELLAVNGFIKGQTGNEELHQKQRKYTNWLTYSFKRIEQLPKEKKDILSHLRQEVEMQKNIPKEKASTSKGQ